MVNEPPGVDPLRGLHILHHLTDSSTSLTTCCSRTTLGIGSFAPLCMGFVLPGELTELTAGDRFTRQGRSFNPRGNLR